jgi:ParB family chromosome partitioning protein
MSKTPVKASVPAAVRVKPQLGAGVLGQLRAAAGEPSQGEPIRIPLVNIDVDPNQPRKSFDSSELDSLAESIKERGVLQAVVVRPAVKGRYLLVMGERRLRASKLAGMANIPAIIRKVEDDDFVVQIIENQQRADLSNSELSGAVLRFADEGRTTKEICNICNLKEYQVAAFRKVGDFPAELRDRLDTSDIRALYDLFRQYSKTPDAVIAALPAIEDPLTITEARRIVLSITGKASGSIILDRAQAETSASAPARTTPSSASHAPPLSKPANSAPQDAETPTIRPNSLGPPIEPVEREGLHGASPSDVPQRRGLPIFLVRTLDGTTGRLIVDQRAERSGWALVELDGAIEEIDPAELTLDRIE